MIIANNVYVRSNQDVVLNDEFRAVVHRSGNTCSRPNNYVLSDRYAVRICRKRKRPKLSMRTEAKKLPATKPGAEALRMQKPMS
jgi:hypothetical protein